MSRLRRASVAIILVAAVAGGLSLTQRSSADPDPVTCCAPPPAAPTATPESPDLWDAPSGDVIAPDPVVPEGTPDPIAPDDNGEAVVPDDPGASQDGPATDNWDGICSGGTGCTNGWSPPYVPGGGLDLGE